MHGVISGATENFEGRGGGGLSMQTIMLLYEACSFKEGEGESPRSLTGSAALVSKGNKINLQV